FLKEIYIAYWDSVNVVWDLELVDIPFMLDPSELFVTSDGKNRFLMYDETGVYEITGGSGIWNAELIYEGDVGDPHLALDNNENSHVIFHAGDWQYGVRSNGIWSIASLPNLVGYSAVAWDPIENAVIAYSQCLRRYIIRSISEIEYAYSDCDFRDEAGGGGEPVLNISDDGTKHYLVGHGIYYQSLGDGLDTRSHGEYRGQSPIYWGRPSVFRRAAGVVGY
ncbi:hypothetical protein K8I61_01380, partial [bacterium]|nr:hypothetical protein [bacterium]